MPTTEIALFHLLPGSEIGDPSNPASGVIKASLDTLRTVPGRQETLFGTHVENPSQFQITIHWEAKQSHVDFQASESYGPFLKHFMSIVDTSGPRPEIFHVDFSSTQERGLEEALSAPVTENVVFYFEGAPPADYLENVAKFWEPVRQGTGLRGWAGGITHEEIEYEGVKGRAAMFMAGWNSVDEHMQARESEAFKENAKFLRHEGVKARRVWHVAFLKDAGGA